MEESKELLHVLQMLRTQHPNAGVKSIVGKLRIRGQQNAMAKITRAVTVIRRLHRAEAEAHNLKQQLVNEQHARAAAEAAAEKLRHPEDSVECVVCNDSDSRSRMALCSMNCHAMCSGCFVPYIQEQLRQDDAIIRDRAAQLQCPSRLPQMGGCQGVFSEDQLAKNLPKSLYDVHMQQLRMQIRAEEAMQANDLMNRMAAKVLPGLSQEMVERQMLVAVPGARQCARCGHGPIEHYKCEDLQTHQGEVSGPGRTMVNNACPICGWFAETVRDWPPWNGKLKYSASDAADAAAKLEKIQTEARQEQGRLSSSREPRQGRFGVRMSEGVALPFARPQESDEAITQRMQMQEQQRLEQIRADHAFAERMQRGL